MMSERTTLRVLKVCASNSNSYYCNSNSQLLVMARRLSHDRNDFFVDDFIVCFLK